MTPTLQMGPWIWKDSRAGGLACRHPERLLINYIPIHNANAPLMKCPPKVRRFWGHFLYSDFQGHFADGCNPSWSNANRVFPFLLNVMIQMLSKSSSFQRTFS